MLSLSPRHTTMTSKLPTHRVGTTKVSAIEYGAMGISSFYAAAAPDEEQFKVTSASARWCSDVSHNAHLLRCSMLSSRPVAPTGTPQTCTAIRKSSSVNGQPLLTPLFARLSAESHAQVPAHRERSEIFLATKYSAGLPSEKTIDCLPAYVREALNKSPEKLGVDYIDLYYAHR